VVTNGGPEGQEYTLVAGARRMAAYEFNGWQNRDVPCVIREYKKGDFLGPIVDNWTENSQRVDVSFADQAEWVHKLVNGAYPVPEGEVAEKVDKGILQKRLGITANYLNKMLRSVEKIDPSVAKKVKKIAAPARLVLALAQVEGTGKDPEEKQATRAAKQDELVEQYKEEQKALEEAGRTRSVRKDKGVKGKKKKKEPESSGELRLSRTLDDNGNKAEDYLAVLDIKRSKGSSAEKTYYTGQYDMLRWLTGGVKRCPEIVAADFKLIEPEPESDEK
jgi:hypothetical protein